MEPPTGGTFAAYLDWMRARGASPATLRAYRPTCASSVGGCRRPASTWRTSTCASCAATPPTWARCGTRRPPRPASSRPCEAPTPGCFPRDDRARSRRRRPRAEAGAQAAGDALAADETERLLDAPRGRRAARAARPRPARAAVRLRPARRGGLRPARSADVRSRRGARSGSRARVASSGCADRRRGRGGARRYLARGRPELAPRTALGALFVSVRGRPLRPSDVRRSLLRAPRPGRHRPPLAARAAAHLRHPSARGWRRSA